MDLKAILQSIAKSLKVTAQDMAKKRFPKYFPLPMEFIIPGWQCGHNLYNRIEHKEYAKNQGDLDSPHDEATTSLKEEEENQSSEENVFETATYEVLFKPEEIITCDTLEELERNQKTNLYVESKYRLKFVATLTHQILAKFNDPQPYNGREN